MSSCVLAFASSSSSSSSSSVTASARPAGAVGSAGMQEGRV